MAKLQSGQGQYTISIPKLMVKKKKWEKGQELIWSFNENGDLVLLEV